MQRAQALSASAARRSAPVRQAVPARIGGPARVAAGLAGLAAAAGALAVAVGPGRATTYAGSSALGAILTVSAGTALILAGVLIGLTRRTGCTGDLALLAGVCWFAPVWVAWQDGPPLIPTVAMVAAGFTFPLIVHLVLAHPSGRLGSKPARVLAGVIYAEALLATVALALFRDPYFDPGCLANCTVNVFLVRSLPSLARAVELTDRWFTAVAAAVLIGVCAARLARASRPARQRFRPVYIPAVGFAVALVTRAVALQKSIVEDPFNTALFTIFAVGGVAVTLLAAGLISMIARSRAERRAVARIAASLDETPAPGLLQSALAAALHDPGLQIAYWLAGPQHYVDASGQPVPEPAATTSRAVTHLTRLGRTIAAISHSGAVPGIESQIGPAIRLGLENERLQAELLAQLEELRASRARIVQTGDAARRSLERNLHDGAQQRVLALSYEIRLAHAAAQADADTLAEAALARAAGETQSVLQELRELAHGIYPAVLAEAGIRPALATIADIAPMPVEIIWVGRDRCPEGIEAAAYFAAEEALSDAAHRGAGSATVTAVHDAGRLVVTIEDDGFGGGAPMMSAADRVGALGGSLVTGPARCQVEIPCG
jgi:signal transduction histidine kinase